MSISICMRRVRKEHLGRQMRIDELLVIIYKLLFQLNTKKKIRFVVVITKSLKIYSGNIFKQKN